MAIASPEADRIHFTAINRLEMETKIEEGVSFLRIQAGAHSAKGILVTRHSAYDFSLALHEDVPFGVTFERQEW